MSDLSQPSLALDDAAVAAPPCARCRIANELAHAAGLGAIDLADEATVIDFLEARGWHPRDVQDNLTDALDVARGILARARLSGFIGNAVAALVLLSPVLLGSEARAAICPVVAEPEGWSSLAVAAVSLFSAFAGVVIMAVMCIGGDVASEEERRDPENMRRS